MNDPRAYRTADPVAEKPSDREERLAAWAFGLTAVAVLLCLPYTAWSVWPHAFRGLDPRLSLPILLASVVLAALGLTLGLVTRSTSSNANVARLAGFALLVAYAIQHLLIAR